MRTFKPSKAPWLDEVPSDWAESPLFTYFRARKQKNKGMVESNVLSLSYGQIKRRDVDSGMGLLPESFETYQIVEPGDIVMRLTDLQNDKRSLRTGLVGERGIVTSAYVALAANERTDSRFAHYLLHSLDTRKVFYGLGAGVRQTMGYDDLSGMPLAMPPLPAQRSIATYLDSEASRIDSLIDRKQRFIDLLLEKRTALITHAVTKGLDPDVEMKDWPLTAEQQVPAHWGLLRAKYVTAERDVRSTDGSEELLTVSHITGVTPRSEKKVYMFMAVTNEGYKTCRKGDLAINTMWAYQGAAGIAPCDGIVSPSYNVYSFTRAVDSEYYDMLVRTRPMIAEFESRSTGIWKSRLRLYPSEFLDIWLPVPPVDEQRAIVAAVNTRVGDTNALVNKTLASIELLKEYRTALISAAVTGQIEIPAADPGEDVA